MADIPREAKMRMRGLRDMTVIRCTFYDHGFIWLAANGLADFNEHGDFRLTCAGIERAAEVFSNG